jgi:hypothetical protein
MAQPDKIKQDYFSHDALDLLCALQLHQVRYILVGGEAVIYYGHTRLTGDIDFFYDHRNDNPRRLFAALQDFWGGDTPGIEKAEDLAVENVIVQFGRPPRRIDLISTIDGVTFDQVWSNSIELEIEGESAAGKPLGLRLIGLSDLIKNKKASNRHKDQEDLEFLEKIKP